MQGNAPAIRYEVSGPIFNPWYVYPILTISGPQGTAVKAADICTPCTMALPQQQLVLVAGARDLTFSPTGSTGEANIDSVRAYLMYRTFLNFNVSYVAFTPNPLPVEVRSVTFFLIRTKRVEKPFEGGVRLSYKDTKEVVEVTATEMSNFVRILDGPLARALDFYLRVSEARYMLIEYYKAFESIAEALGGLNSAMKILTRYGVSKAERSRFTKVCNDQSQQPSDVGRHAAMPGVPVWRVNNRDPLIDPRFVAAFEQATSFCRSVIDAYIRHRVGHA